MSNSTNQIEREIEQTRADIDATLAVLRSRMSVGDVIDEVSRQFRASGGPEVMRNFGRQVKANPLPLALIGAGLAWLMIGNGRAAYRHEHDYALEPYEPYDHLPEEAAYDTDYEYDPYTGTRSSQLPPTGAGPSAGAAVSPDAQIGSDGGEQEAHRRAAAAMSETASSAASRTGEAASAAAATVSKQAQRAGAQARWAARRTSAGAARTGRSVQRNFLDLVNEQPLVVGIMGVAVGAAIGALLPPTRTEDEWVGPARDRVRDEAARMGREQYDKATHVAEKAYETARSEADAQGLTPQEDKTVAERVEEVAKSTAETAQSEAERQDLGKP